MQAMFKCHLERDGSTEHSVLPRTVQEKLQVIFLGPRTTIEDFCEKKGNLFLSLIVLITLIYLKILPSGTCAH